MGLDLLEFAWLSEEMARGSGTSEFLTLALLNAEVRFMFKQRSRSKFWEHYVVRQEDMTDLHDWLERRTKKSYLEMIPNFSQLYTP